MKQVKQVVRLSNGKYVKDWQYSQGYFDVEETADVLEAVEIDKENFMVFFMEKGHKLFNVDVTIVATPVSEAEHEAMRKKMKVARAKQKKDGKRLGKNNAIYDYL